MYVGVHLNIGYLVLIYVDVEQLNIILLLKFSIWFINTTLGDDSFGVLKWFFVFSVFSSEFIYVSGKYKEFSFCYHISTLLRKRELLCRKRTLNTMLEKDKHKGGMTDEESRRMDLKGKGLLKTSKTRNW